MIKRFEDFENIDDVTAGAKVVTREGELKDILPVLAGCLDEISRSSGWFGSPEMIAKCKVDGDTAYYEMESKTQWANDGYLLLYMMPQTFTPYLLFGFSENDVDLHHLKISDLSFSIRDIEHKFAVTSRIRRIDPTDGVNRIIAKIRVHS